MGVFLFSCVTALIHLPVWDLINVLGQYTKPLGRTGGAAHSRSDSREQRTARWHFQDPLHYIFLRIYFALSILVDVITVR